MESKIQARVEQDIIRVSGQGPISAEIGTAMMKLAAQHSHESGSRLFLVDLRQMHITESFSSLYERPKLAKELDLVQDTRTAFLCTQYDEKLQFLENVIVNRGQVLQIFTDEKEALAWLRA